MQFKPLALAALAGLTAAQSNETLTQVLNGTSNLSNLTSLLAGQPALLATLGNLTNITVLAPTNDAFAEFLNSSTAGALMTDDQLVQGILSYHILNGTYQNFTDNATFVPTALMPPTYTNVTGGQVVEVRNDTVFSGLRSNSSIVMSSVNFTGGVIHMIDRVLTVPLNISATAQEFGLSSMVGALNATNQTEAVDYLSDVTVFVPNNAAFQSIGSALPNLTTDEITAILQYHVINGTVGYSSMLGNMSLPTLQGNNLTITVVNSSTIFVNDARVVIPDILVANGVVHVIDQVLNPNNSTAASGGNASGAPAFSGASSATEAPYTSNVPTPTSSIATESIASQATAGSTSTSSAGAWSPKATGAVGAAALGGLAFIMQL